MADLLDFSAFSDDPANSPLAAAGPSDVVSCGWIPPDERSAAGTQAHNAIIGATDDLRISGSRIDADTTKVCLWDCWNTARPAGWPGIRQITGSCVGAGGGNALFSLAAADVVKRRDPERVEVPFWLLPYGISRMLGGLHDRGDGSFGSTFAKAVSQYGHIPANVEGLPAYTDTDGYSWGETNEKNWSQGRKIKAEYLDAAKPHLVRKVALCQSTDDVRDALRNYYPVTCASNWGGAMRPPIQGAREPVLLNRRRTTWQHQMSVQAWRDHPEFGELFYLLNQWGQETHGRCPSGAPPGGFWIAKPDMRDIVSQGETFAFSELDGFPSLNALLDFSAF